MAILKRFGPFVFRLSNSLISVLLYFMLKGFSLIVIPTI